MSESDLIKWDQRYRDGSYRARTHPTPYLERWLPQLPRGLALDVACGTGRNALFLAAHDYRVDAVDISPVALAAGRDKGGENRDAVRWIQADLDQFVPERSCYDLIVVARYVNRLLIPRIEGALKPGGALVYEHHFRTDEPVDGPRDPDFRLAPGELESWFKNLDIRDYREGLLRDPDGRLMALAQMVAFRPDRAPATSAE